MQRNGRCAFEILIIWTRILICSSKGDKTKIHHEIICSTYFSFHNKLKHNPDYLNSQRNRRCYVLLRILLKLEEDQYFAIQQKQKNLKVKKAMFKKKSRHIKAISIDWDSINVTY